MPSTPPAGAQTTTLQVMSYNPVTDGHTLVLDLNDHAAFTIRVGTLKLPQPPKSDSRSFNLRTPGERIVKWQYKNRHITAQLNLRALTPTDPTSTTQLLTDVRNLLAAIEHPPYELRIALPKATQYSYADVVQVTHTIPSDPQEILAGAIRAVAIDFECLPGLRGDRLTLQNLVMNPGFEAPSGPGVVAFSDFFDNFNAYTVQAGGALTQDSTTYADAVLQDAPLRYYRLDEASGLVVYDASAQANNGSYPASGITYGVAGGLSGDADTGVTVSGGRVFPGGNLAGGNAPFTVDWLFKFAANPASTQGLYVNGNQTLTNLQNVRVNLDTSGHVVADVGGSTLITSTVVATGVWHYVALRYDGAGTLKLTVDGTTATATGIGTLALPTSGSISHYWGAQQNGIGFFIGQLDECAEYATMLADAQITAHHTLQSSGPTASQANTMVVPSGGRVSFGSPVWSAYNTWQVRFRYASSLTASFYLHYTDANNYLAAVVTGTSLTLNQNIAGSIFQLGTTSINLVPGVPVWLMVTQFPTVSPTNLVNNVPAQVQARLYADSAGTLGSSAKSSLVVFGTLDGLTAISGRPHVAASGAALSLGGSYATAPNQVALFRPGAWSFSNAGTGVAALALDSGTTYTGGPVTSQYAARLDLAPAGTVDAKLRLYTGGAAPAYSGAGTWAIPVAAATDVLGLSAYVKTSAGLGNTATLTLQVTEYDANGAQLRQNTAATLTGPHTAWTALSANYTTGASCAYVDLALRVLDSTTNSAGQQVWWDNAQCWDQTSTGQTTMPYCELRHAQAPGQVMVSGLAGDMEAPMLSAVGIYAPGGGGGWAGQWFQVYLGRAATYQPAGVWVGQDIAGGVAAGTLVLDATSYGGYYRPLTSLGNAFVTLGAPVTLPTLNGRYHVLGRATLKSASVPSVQTNLLENASTPLITFAQLGSTTTPGLTQNVPGVVDAGPVVLPPIPQVSMTTGSTISLKIQVQWVGAGTGAINSDWLALLPIDSGLWLSKLTSNGYFQPVQQWAWFYADGLAQGALVDSPPAPAYSVEAAALANPGAAVGGPSVATSAPSFASTADTYLTLNPALAANQFLAVVIDDAGDVMPLAVEGYYVPLYLYPR